MSSREKSSQIESFALTFQEIRTSIQGDEIRSRTFGHLSDNDENFNHSISYSYEANSSYSLGYMYSKRMINSTEYNIYII